jgi:probable F420-dependent oxidoreductase
VTPIVSLNPRVARDWEGAASPEDLAVVVQAADRLGYHHLTCSEHVAVPVDADARRGRRYYDPAVTLAWAAARTEQILLATHVLVAAYHHPLEVAKTYGTLDVLSGGRVVLGVGLGSLREEFDLLGATFEGRGAQADDFLRALRTSWGRREPRYRGSVYAFDGVVVDPCACTDDPEIWVGGRTARSLRRALDLGDGWVPFGLSGDDVARLLGRARSTRAWSTRRRPFEVVLAAEELDPVGDAEGCRGRLEALVALGATVVDARLAHRSLGHLLEQMDALVGLAEKIDADLP